MPSATLSAVEASTERDVVTEPPPVQPEMRALDVVRKRKADAEALAMKPIVVFWSLRVVCNTECVSRE